MKKDKTRAPSRNTESEQLASLRIEQKWHEWLAREHAASATRLWLRRVLLELGQEKQEGKRKATSKREGKGSARAQQQVGRRNYAEK